MFIISILTLFTSLFAVAAAWNAPTYSGWTRKWQEPFIGSRYSLPSSSNWNYRTGSENFNGELQTYTTNSASLRLSGSNTLQIIPMKDSAGKWTSGRIESKYVFTPAQGKMTRIEASLRLPGNAPEKSGISKQGIWPAFWTLGDSYRKGTLWPACGELDIMENINGQNVVHGVMHCDVAPGGRCNEPSGLGSTTSLNDGNYHVWRIDFNRRSTNHREQVITWYRDGVQFARITGLQVGPNSVWENLAKKPMFFILNVAVGGAWVRSFVHYLECAR